VSRGSKPPPRPRRTGGAKTAPTRGALRVVSGTLGGRRIDVPAGSSTRPTSDRVREAIFNALDSLDAVQDKRVLDAFAGSGALGIEALSRGAQHATFADTDAAARAVIDDNIRALQLGASATVVASPAARVIAGAGPFGLVLLDPPYSFEEWDDLLLALVPVLEPDGLVVLESDHEVPLPAPLSGVRTKTYGGTVVQFATLAGATS
jgi:16S rRNA (guanine966-N2)-methyltransferase